MLSRTNAVALLLCLGAIRFAMAAEHPTLVDVTTARCETCHETTISNNSKHVRDTQSCLQCHRFGRENGKTIVTLLDAATPLCVGCHQESAAQAAGTVSAPHKPVVDACTNCHDPHDERRAMLLKANVPALCLSCHPADGLNGSHTRPVARANCLNCHNPHGSNHVSMLRSDKLHKPFEERTCQTCHRTGLGLSMKARPPELCYACHGAEKFAKAFVHTAVKQGKCTGCHEPHLAEQDNLLRAAQPKLCVTCHESIAKRMAAKTSHFPTQDSCLNCHDAHASDNPSQLNDTVPGLCTTCHEAEESLVAKHLGADFKKVRCTGCHDPHGSPEPHLWNGTIVHPPFAEKACEFCHEGNYKKLLNDGTKDLCYTCHTDIQELVTESKVKHPAFEIAECTDCHTPHASLQQKLVKHPGGKVCTDCHNDKGPEEGEKAHGVIDLLGCRACHEPHGGPRKSMLRIEGVDLCLGCHLSANRKVLDNGQVQLLGRFRITAAQAAKIPALPIVNGRNHPVANHRVIGAATAEELSRVSVEFKGELSCFTCHNPHKGRHKLFVDGAKSATEMCMRCHKK